mgnify:CR=1 FL=1
MGTIVHEAGAVNDRDDGATDGRTSECGLVWSRGYRT